jgi:hypothetical protein
VGRIVHIDTGYQTVSAVQDLLEVKLATTQAGFLHSAIVMQSSDEASNEAEELKISVKRATGSFTSGSAGGSATVVKGQSGDAAHGLTTIERNNTTQAVIGTGTLDEIGMMCGAFAVLSGEWERTPTPELRPPIGPSEAIILSLEEAPTDALTLRAILVIEITHG